MYLLKLKIIIHQLIKDSSKRIFDITLSLVGLLSLAPILIIIGVCIKINSSGPVIYKGLRSGRYGKPFYIYKFRSMAVGAESGAGTTSRNDPRITFIGKSLRKYKVDELPQLLNVLKGEMSFVGPRPELLRYTAIYEGKELLILTVKPGITDYSSIKFSNLNEMIRDEDPDKDYENKIIKKKNKLRIMYVEKQTFCGDINLIFLTLIKIWSAK